SGVHHLPLVTCNCQGTGKKVSEAVIAGFLPSSFKDIKTLFTTSCLDDFRLANLECKTSAYQYYQMLRRRTNPSNPTAVPDRYAELRRASREWRHLKKLKQSGSGHSHVAPGTGDFTVFCPACPQEGINIPADADISADPNLYTRTFVTDGNFSADHLKQKRPGDDVWLWNGEGLMTNRHRYAAHLRVAIEQYTDAPCNHNFHAVDDANRTSTTNDVTGIVAVACARHGCFAPGSVSDLQKGERQMNVDWAVAEGIRNTNIPLNGRILMLYDIFCQWSIYQKWRFDEPSGHLTLPAGLKIDGGIGLFHVHGHREECLHRYATYYIPGAAVVDGEVLERLWSVLNMVSRSTRTATLAHRAEVLDDHMADNNWKKLIGMVAVVCKRYEGAVDSTEETLLYYDELTAAVDLPTLRKWTKEIEYAERKRTVKIEVMDVMATKGSKPQTRADAELELVEGSAKADTATVRWLMTGLTLEEDQLHLQIFIYRKGRYPTKAERLDIGVRRGRLRARIDKFQREGLRKYDDDAQGHLAGDAAHIDLFEYRETGLTEESDIGAEAGTEAEKIQLALPSSFPPAYLDKLGLNTLRDQELSLRRGQANDALQAIRLAIGQRSFQYTSNMRADTGKALKTRSRSAIQGLGHTISANRRMYVKCRAAMVTLGMPEQELQVTYRPITDKDVQTDTSIHDPNRPGASKAQVSWIFTAGGAQADGPDFMKEYYRVHWLRARAHARRWSEELRLTEHEMQWTTRFFLFKSDGWVKFRDTANGSNAAGAVAYAERQIHFWQSMAERAEDHFKHANSNYVSLL
ncbi:hypothetical protein GALMADRAFT_82316, partial [Galerina marginata CBS 339.88]